jgi:hypothetical protein
MCACAPQFIAPEVSIQENKGMTTFNNLRRDFLRTGGWGWRQPQFQRPHMPRKQRMVRALECRRKASFDVRKFGAAGDGKTLDTGCGEPCD